MPELRARQSRPGAPGRSALWISMIVVLAGAQLNAEIERETAELDLRPLRAAKPRTVKEDTIGDAGLGSGRLPVDAGSRELGQKLSALISSSSVVEKLRRIHAEFARPRLQRAVAGDLVVFDGLG